MVRPRRAPPGFARIGHFHNDWLDFIRNNQHGWDEIGAQLVGQHVAIFHLEIFHQGAALRLGNRAFGLTLHQLWVDGLSNIIGAVCRKLLARIFIILKEQRPYIIR